jgi:hypothetical protein
VILLSRESKELCPRFRARIERFISVIYSSFT